MCSSCLKVGSKSRRPKVPNLGYFLIPMVSVEWSEEVPKRTRLVYGVQAPHPIDDKCIPHFAKNNVKLKVKADARHFMSRSFVRTVREKTSYILYWGRRERDSMRCNTKKCINSNSQLCGYLRAGKKQHIYLTFALIENFDRKSCRIRSHRYASNFRVVLESSLDTVGFGAYLVSVTAAKKRSCLNPPTAIESAGRLVPLSALVVYI